MSQPPGIAESKWLRVKSEAYDLELRSLSVLRDRDTKAVVT